MEIEEEVYASVRISFLCHFSLVVYSVIISELYEDFSTTWRYYKFNINFLSLLQNQIWILQGLSQIQVVTSDTFLVKRE